MSRTIVCFGLVDDQAPRAAILERALQPTQALHRQSDHTIWQQVLSEIEQNPLDVVGVVLLV